MDTVVALFVLVCVLGMIASIPIALGWMRRWGFSGAKDAFTVGGGCFAAIFMVALFSAKPESSATTGEGTGPSRVTSSQATIAPPVQQRPTLDKIRIEHVLWEKGGFGSVMVATFRIDNNNSVRIKDVQVTCRHYSNSGSQIDSNTRTIYEMIEPRSYHYVRDMNMGFIHSAATKTNCRPTKFIG